MSPFMSKFLHVRFLIVSGVRKLTNYERVDRSFVNVNLLFMKNKGGAIEEYVIMKFKLY